MKPIGGSMAKRKSVQQKSEADIVQEAAAEVAKAAAALSAKEPVSGTKVAADEPQILVRGAFAPETLAPASETTASIANRGDEQVPAPAPSRRFALLAASVAAAAVLGSVTGSLMTALFQGSPATAA